LIFVFDSNLWVSALQFGGAPLAALDYATGQHRIAVCEHILSEIHSVLEGKFLWHSEAVDAALAEYALVTFFVHIRGSVQGVCRDHDDDPVIECAALADADVIVSGDKDLLAVGEYEGIRIVTPRAFLDEFAGTIPS
jgi:putative PIN family toxin of toxin-antitoxin system